VLITVGISACSGEDGAQTEGQPKPAQSQAAAATPAEPVKLKMWHPMNSSASAVVKNLGEVKMVQEWQKRTNTEFEFLHPTGGTGQDVNQQLGVMLASGNLPDLMVWYWSNASKMYSDGTIVNLKELIDQHAPNLKKVLDANPSVAKQIKADNGDIYVFPDLRTGPNGKYKTFSGMIIRQDWLDELGLSSPETIDEWETVLRAFKEKKGATPLIAAKDSLFGSSSSKDLMGAYGIGQNFYQEDGIVKYGPLQPAFKQYLERMRKWYQEGLIDPDYATNDTKARDAKVSSGKAGAFYGYIGGQMGTLFQALQKNEPQAKLAAVQYPVLNKGDEPQFTMSTWDFNFTGAVITKTNKHPAETVKALDYLYSEEGTMLKNFGIEGETYTMVNGQPKYTDLIMNNPDKLPIGQAMAKYFIASYEFAGPSDDRYNDQYYANEEQKNALTVYSKYADNYYKKAMPPISMTTEETTEYSKIITDINTFRNETVTKIIMGSAPLESYGEAIEQLKKMKIDRAIEIQQAALDRYNKR
jgi:putative aldouronate transport system substrate-binding protein